MTRWLALLLVVLGVVLVGVGLFDLELLLVAPFESQQAYLAKTIFPTVGGFWLFIGGVYALTR